MNGLESALGRLDLTVKYSSDVCAVPLVCSPEEPVVE